MPRRKKRWWKPNINQQSLQSVIALIAILIGVLTIIAYIGTAVGVSNFLQQLFFFIFGYAAILLPLNLFAIGLSFTKLKHPTAEPRILWGTTLLTTALSIMFSTLSTQTGGWFGNYVGKFASPYITTAGVFLTALTGVVIAVIITFNTTLDQLSKVLQTVTAPLTTMFKSMVSSVKQNQSSEESNLSKETPAAVVPPVAEIPTVSIKSNTGPEIEILDENDSTQNNPISNTIATKPNHSSTPGVTINRTLEFVSPPITLLSEPKAVTTDRGLIEKNAQIIERTLSNFGIQARIAEVNLGPAVTQYAIDLAEGTRTSKITSLQTDLALALASPTGNVRVESPIPGKRLIGIEVPNQNLTIVGLKNILLSEAMKQNPSKLAVALGEDVSGKPVIAQVDKWPHILIAGATGSGKSALLHSIINSILFRATPEEVSFIMIDPKRVELTEYNDIPHLRTPVIVDSEKTINAFKWAVTEMEKRYRLFQQLSARNLADFNEHTDTEKLPYVIIVVDELADLMAFAANDMEMLITRIAQKARATGIFMILSTQRPSVDVITGLIKANVPARISLNVTSGTDSRVIIDQVGAEKLLGKGDMFYLPSDAGAPKRVQGVYVYDEEIHRVTEYLSQFASPYGQSTNINTYSNVQSTEGVEHSMSDPSEDQDGPDDDKFNDSVKVILNHDKASASLLQRRLKIGYARAARILDDLQAYGLVSEPDGSNPRDVNTEAAKAYLSKIGINLDTNITHTNHEEEL